MSDEELIEEPVVEEPIEKPVEPVVVPAKHSVEVMGVPMVVYIAESAITRVRISSGENALTVLSQAAVDEILEKVLTEKTEGWKQYPEKVPPVMRPYVPGEDLSGIVVEDGVVPTDGGMIFSSESEPKPRYMSKNDFDDIYESEPVEK